MPNFKRFLSGIMALVITLSMFSCLGAVVANAEDATYDYYGTNGKQVVYGPMVGDKSLTLDDGKTNVSTWRGLRNGADDWCKALNKSEFETFNDTYQNYKKGFGVKSYAKLAEEYGDKMFVYTAIAIYETDDDGETWYLTDHKVKYGQTLQIRQYIKSNVFICNASIDTVFTRAFFDVNSDYDFTNIKGKKYHAAYCDSELAKKTGDTLNNAGYAALYDISEDTDPEYIEEPEESNDLGTAFGSGEIKLTASPSATSVFFNQAHVSSSMLPTSNKFDYVLIYGLLKATQTTAISAKSDLAVYQYQVNVRSTEEASNRSGPITTKAEATAAYDTIKTMNIGAIGEVGVDFHYSREYYSDSPYTFDIVTDDTSNRFNNRHTAYEYNVITDTRDMNHTFRLYGNEVKFYDADGKTLMGEKEYDYSDDSVDLTVTVSDIVKSTDKAGYEFKGWDLATATTDDSGNTIYKGDGVADTVNGTADDDYTYVAIYDKSASAVTYKVNYIYNGNNIGSEELEAGAALTLPTDKLTVITGKKIVWTYVNADTSETIDAVTAMPAHNLTVTATLEDIKYTITYPEGYEAQTYTYGQTVTPHEITQDETGVIKSWTFSPELEDGKMPASDVTATISTTKQNYEVKFVCSQDATGDQTKTKTFEYGTTYKLSDYSDFTVDSTYKLVKWVSSDNQTITADEASTTELTATGNVTWTAYYQGVDVNLTFQIKLDGTDTVVWSATKAAHAGDQMSQYVPTASDYTGSIKVDGATKDFAGYDFTTWTVDSTVKTTVTTFTATIKPKKFTLTLKDEFGTEFSSQQVEYDTALSSYFTSAEAKVRSGYTAGAWDNGSVTNMPAVNTTYTLSLTPIEYKVTFFNNDGTSDSEVVSGLYYKDGNAQTFTAADGKVPTFTRTGYNFLGWSTNSQATSGDITSEQIASSKITDSLEFYAVWEKATYTITYQTNKTDGTTYDNWVAKNYTLSDYTTYSTTTFNGVQSFKYGDPITLEDAPTATGYVYDGWTLYTEDGKVVSSTSTMPAQNLIAKSTGVQQYYTDEFIGVDGKTVLYTQHYIYGASIIEPDLPTVAGYSNPSWAPADRIQKAENMTFKYVSGSASLVHYTVEIYTENLDGTYTVSNTIKDRQSQTGSTVSVTENDKTLTGYTYVEDKSIPSATVSGEGDTVLTVYLKRNVHTITIVGDNDSAKNIATEYKFGAPISAYVPTEKTGNSSTVIYTRGSTSITLPTAMPDYDITVTVAYKPIDYTITYYVDGVEYTKAAATAQYNDTVTLPAYEKVGYTFNGWTLDDEAISGTFTMPANNVKIYGTTTIQKHKFIFMNGDEVFKTLEGDYGTAVDFSTVGTPTQVGATFSRWDATYTTFQAYDVTINAVFSTDAHKANFYKEDGSLYRQFEVKYGAELTKAEDAPSKTGHSFTGWYIGTDKTKTYTTAEVKAMTMGTEDINFYPVYTANTYTATFYANATDTTAHDTQTNITFGTAGINKPATDPVKSGYNFKGWKISTDSTDTIVSFPYTMNAEGITFTGVWEQDTTSCSIESIELASSEPYTGRAQRSYKITLKEGVDAFSIMVYRGNGSWYEFNKAAFAKYGENSLVTEITTEGNKQVWYVNMILPEATNTYYAYVVYSNGVSGDENTYFRFDVKYAAKTEAQTQAEFIDCKLDTNSVVRGGYVTWTIKTSKDVSWLKFDYSYTANNEDKSYSIYYKKDNANKEGDDRLIVTDDDTTNTTTWVIKMSVTYSGTDAVVNETFKVSYRVGTLSTYYVGSSDNVITVGYNAAALTKTPDTVAKFSLISVDVKEGTTATQGKYGYIVIKTTADCTKVRVAYNNPSTGKMKYGTYQTTSKNVEYSDDDTGVRTWTIKFKFIKGVTEYKFDARGIDWCTQQTLTPTFA